MPDPANTAGDGGRLWLLLFLLLLVCQALCAAAEAAVQNVSESKLRRMAEEDKNRKAAKLLRFLREPSRIARRLHVGFTLTASLAAVLTAVWSICRLLPPLAADWQPAKAHPLAVALLLALPLALLIAVCLLILCEWVPGRIGAHRPEAVLLKIGGFAKVYAALFTPAAALCGGLSDLLVRLFGVTGSAEGAVTEEDIRQLMDAGEETGAIEGTQKDMIENIFAFDDITAEELMTPRTDVEALDVDGTVEDALKICIDEGFSRIPLFEQDIDHIIGVLYAKDLLRYVGRPVPPELTLRGLSHETYFIPGSKRCGELFTEMTEKHLQMSVVVDEYGGVAGIVTMEDLLESIVGNIQDEYDHEEDELRRTGENSFEVDGAMSMEELCELWEITPPEGEFDTVAGFILDVLGRIPAPGEHARVVYDRLTLTVLTMDGRRIEKIHVQVAPPPAEE